MCNSSWKMPITRHSKKEDNKTNLKERVVKKIVWRTNPLLYAMRTGCFQRQELPNKGELASRMPKAII